VAPSHTRLLPLPQPCVRPAYAGEPSRKTEHVKNLRSTESELLPRRWSLRRISQGRKYYVMLQSQVIICVMIGSDRPMSFALVDKTSFPPKTELLQCDGGFLDRSTLESHYLLLTIVSNIFNISYSAHYCTLRIELHRGVNSSRTQIILDEIFHSSRTMHGR
jgi:hypothetical protein